MVADALTLAGALKRFKSLEGLDELPIGQARELSAREAPLMFGRVEEVGSAVDRLIAGEIRARVYEPAATTACGTLVFFHGGGWAFGSVETHDGAARFLCNHGACTVVSVDYRLAPEQPFPAALDDAWAATRWAARELRPPLAVAGDSAGGNLAAVVARRARDAGLAIALQLLVYPALDLRPGSRWMRQYLDGQPATDPDASPALAPDLTGIAPALILSCELDDLRPQADAYTDRLRQAGVAVRHVVYPGLIHKAFCMPGVLPGGRKMLEDGAEALATAFA